MGDKKKPEKVASPRSEMSEDDLQRISEARMEFLSAALNMSWQLAVTIIVPVIIGVQLDNHFNSSPSYTLAALFLAVFISCGVVVKTLHGVKTNQFKKKNGRNKDV